MNRSSRKSRSGPSPNGGRGSRGSFGFFPLLGRSSAVSHSSPKNNRSLPCRSSSSSQGRRALMRSKSDSGDGGLKHLVDYSTKRATYNDANRSRCRGPVMSRVLYEPESNKIQKSISARGLDWNVLSSTMDLSNESADRVRKVASNKQPEEEQQQQQGPDQMNRSCSERLRQQLARSCSTSLVEPAELEEAGTGVDHVSVLNFAQEEGGSTAPPLLRSKSVGASTHTAIAFRRPHTSTS